MPEPQQKPQADPWEAAAQAYKQGGGQAASPENSNADWKLWTQNGTADDSDTRNAPQKSFDTETQTSPNEPLLKTALKSVTGAIGGAFVHPLKTVESMSHMGNPYDPEDPLAKQITGTMDDYSDAGGGKHGLAYAGTKLLGNAFGSYALGEGVGSAGRFVNTRLAPAAETLGQDTINGGLLATPAKMMKGGQNPARGLVNEGMLPTLSRSSLERKLAARLPVAGQEVASQSLSAAPIPRANLAGRIENPIMEQADVASGFGGTNKIEPLADLWGMMERPAPAATGPIYGPRAPELVPAGDVWKSRMNLDKNTRFNPDPEIEGVNEIRRDIRGGLQDELVKANPQIGEAAQNYSDLRTADDALDRHVSKGIGRVKDLAKTPVLSTAGWGLVRGGRLARAFSGNPFLNRLPGAAGLFSAPSTRNGDR